MPSRRGSRLCAEGHGFWSWAAWVGLPAVSFTTCVMLGELLDLSVPGGINGTYR